MWFLRRKSRNTELEPELLPPATGPMRRIEITVERQWISKVAGAPAPGVAPAVGREPQLSTEIQPTVPRKEKSK